MIARFEHLRRRFGVALALPALLLLLGIVVGGVHHHDGGASERSCSVCAMSHAPAVASVAATPLAAPTVWREQVLPAYTGAIASRPTHDHAGRAPPSA